MMEGMSTDEPRIVEGPELTAAEVYGIWKIRDLVFAFEQHCEEPEVDDLDLLPGTVHLWFADAQGPTSYIRVYRDAGGILHLGRVATRKDQRGQGLAGRLLRAAHERWAGEEIAISAQAYLEQWYAGFGYQRRGDEYMEAGIPHVPMHRPAMDVQGSGSSSG